ncbi:GNAT family N-acetyltransferase [candidate division KSB1 bacterium]|nr:GNAT family N-acetyltransferase [candidate division KSB1 bacterium]
MIALAPLQAATLKAWFLPERAGPLVGLHVLNTGNGVCWVDRWPAPRGALMMTADNYALAGDPSVFDATELRTRIRGFVETAEGFLPLLKTAFPDCKRWERVIFEKRAAAKFHSPNVFEVRRLSAHDAHHLWGISPDNFWISKTWGGPNGLAASGRGWGAFWDNHLASVACTFYLGEKYEDIGVVTEPQFRGGGLSTTCAAALCEDILARGHQPSWTTSPDNLASIRVAEKLGFVLQRRNVLHVVGIPIPEPVH